jgi:dihydroorotate dehydrogenase electron transfer subunit
MYMEHVDRMERLSADIYRMVLGSARLASTAKPGQFINVLCGDSIHAYLRRPISICDVNPGAATADIVFQVRGAGTERLSRMKPGEAVDVMGPLGNPFKPVQPGGSTVVVGGGIGTFPLLLLLRTMGEVRRTALLGFRNREAVVLEEEFASASDMLEIATDDGSYGKAGFATGLLERFLKHEKPDCVYACGPLPMLKAAVGLCVLHGIPVQVSMEQRMGCGVGACLVCACRKRDGDDFTYAHVCREGPVFDGREIVFD